MQDLALRNSASCLPETIVSTHTPTHQLDPQLATVTLACLLWDLNARGIRLSAESDRITYRDSGHAMTARDAEMIRGCKPALAEFLMASQAVPSPITKRQQPPKPSFTQELWWNALRESARPSKAHCYLTVPFLDVNPKDAVARMRFVVGRHDALRYSFSESHGTLSVTLNDAGTLPVDVVVVRAPDIETRFAALRTKLNDFRRDIISIHDKWLLRIKVFVTSECGGILAVLLHHLIADTGSVGIIKRELSTLLTSKPKLDALAEPMFQFSDYAVWQRKWFSGDRAHLLESYWTAWLARVPRLPHPPHGPFGKWLPGTRVTHRFRFAPNVMRALERASVRCARTEFVILLSLYSIALSRWARVRHFAVLSIADSRWLSHSIALADTVGPILHMDPIEVYIPDEHRLESVSHMLAATYWAARRLHFPINDVPGNLRESTFHHGIPATINYAPGHIDRRSPLLLNMGNRHAHRIGSGTPLPGANLPLQPINLRLMHTPSTLDYVFEFNENVLSQQEQLDVLRHFEDVVKDLLL